MRAGWGAALALIAGLVVGSGPGTAAGAPRAVALSAEVARSAAPLRVMVTLPPQRAFVERIGGNRVTVEVMVPPGADPHTFEPRPAARAQLERAQVYFALGDAFEDVWLSRMAAGRGPRIVRTDAGIAKLGGDPHIWLAPPLVKVQARHIRDALSELDPDGRAFYAANYDRFAAGLDALDRDLKALFAGAPQREFIVFHPAWTYFAQAYGLTQTAVEVDGKNPTPAQMQRLVERMRTRGLRVIFAQPQRSQRMAETVAASVGARVVVADDLAADWEPNLRAVAAQLRGAMEPLPSPSAGARP